MLQVLSRGSLISVFQVLEGQTLKSFIYIYIKYICNLLTSCIILQT